MGGAVTAVAAEANRNPDGLPEGYGAQAQIEKMIWLTLADAL